MSGEPGELDARAARVRVRLEGERRRWEAAERAARRRGEPKRYPAPVGLLRIEEAAARGERR